MLGKSERHGELRRGADRHAGRREAIDDLPDDGGLVRHQFELDLSESFAPTLAAQDPHHIVVDLPEDLIAPAVDSQSLAGRLELDDLRERLTPDDATGHVGHTAGNCVPTARPGQLCALPRQAAAG